MTTRALQLLRGAAVLAPMRELISHLLGRPLAALRVLATA
jgi:hypothetical protein